MEERRGHMKKWILTLLAIFALFLIPAVADGAERSSDTMILDWSTDKVWMDHGNLCVRGTFYNKRSDLTITKLNDMSMKITFTKADGSSEVFMGKPQKLPMLKILAGGSKTVTLNFGPYQGTWARWSTEQEYDFTYINGARW